jgi:putative ABC transport system permease protein
MFLALRDLRFARTRFLAMGATIALLAWLMTLLSGLTSGLVHDGVSGLQTLPASHVAFAADADESFSKSSLSPATWRTIADTPGVERAAPLGNAFLNGRTEDGTGIDLALMGVEPGSFLDPTAGRATRLGQSPDGVFVSPKLVDEGVRPGQTIRLLNSTVELRVAGTVDGGSFGHAGVVYAPLALWQRAVHASAPADERSGASAVALQADDAAAARAASASGTDVITREASYASSPGYSAETSTMSMIQGFLYAIAAVLVGAFFLVWTIQRTSEIGLLKALGAGTRYVLRDALAQAAILLLGAILVGVALGVGTGVLIEGTEVPFRLQTGPVLTAAVLLAVVGLVGVAVSIRRISRVDPLIALGGAR